MPNPNNTSQSLADFTAELAEELDSDAAGQPDDGPVIFTFVGDAALSVPVTELEGRVLALGDTIEVTPEFLELTRDRLGNSWAENLDSDPRFRRGEPSQELLAKLAADAAAALEDERLAQVREGRRFGRQGTGASAEALERAREAAQYAASIRSSREY